MLFLIIFCRMGMATKLWRPVLSLSKYTEEIVWWSI